MGSVFKGDDARSYAIRVRLQTDAITQNLGVRIQNPELVSNDLRMIPLLPIVVSKLETHRFLWEPVINSLFTILP